MDNSIWLIICAAMIFFMQAGYISYETGLVQSKNVISVAVENLFSLSVGLIVFGCLGFFIMFGKYPQGTEGSAFFLVQAMYAMIAVTLFAGAMSERTRITPLIVAAGVAAGIIYPVFGRWVWFGHYGGGMGWLEKLGFMDFSGACVVNMTAGFIALAGIIVVGPRNDYTENSSNRPLAVIGVFIIWVGWFFFNGASATIESGKIPLIFCNVAFAGAAGIIGALEANFMRKERGGYLLSCFDGALSGLVAITALSAYCTPLEAGVVGFMAGALADFAGALMTYKRLDDVVHVVPIHLIGGLVGTISVAGFVDIDYLVTGDRVDQLGVQIITVIFNGLWAFGTSYIMFALMKKFGNLRITAEEEAKGLNVVEFDDLFFWNRYMETSNYQQEILRKNELLQEQTELLTKTEEQEKQKLARDLHDGMGQSLAAMKVMMGVGKMKASNGDIKGLAEVADKVSDLADTSISEMRNVINNLRPLVLQEEGLSGGIRSLVNIVDGAGGLKCSLNFEDPVPDFDDTVSLNLYRLIQESLTNVVKHSHATKVDITCKYSFNNERYSFIVSDNGVGFELDPGNPGVGIRSMSSRMQMLGGRFDIFSHEGSGTTIVMEVPINDIFTGQNH